MEMVWKGIVGGLITAVIVWLSKRGNTLPGILPLFPTFALIALLIVGAKGNDTGFREACIAGAKTIPAYLAFLAVWWQGGRSRWRSSPPRAGLNDDPNCLIWPAIRCRLPARNALSFADLS